MHEILGVVLVVVLVVAAAAVLLNLVEVETVMAPGQWRLSPAIVQQLLSVVID